MSGSEKAKKERDYTTNEWQFQNVQYNIALNPYQRMAYRV